MIVYIAAPYSAPTRDGIARNVRRAVALGRYAAHLGHTPLVPHAQGWMGVYGAGDESEAGVRELALRCSAALAAGVAAAGGTVWAILRDDGSMSEGTRVEYDAYWSARAKHAPAAVTNTWAMWCMMAQERRVSLEAWAEPPVSATLEAALDVHLDHAEDTGRYSGRLRQRVAEALPGMRMAVRVRLDDRTTVYIGADAARPDGRELGRVTLEGVRGPVEYLSATRHWPSSETHPFMPDEEGAAHQYVRESIDAAGWVLAGGAVEAAGARPAPNCTACNDTGYDGTDTRTGSPMRCPVCRCRDCDGYGWRGTGEPGSRIDCAPCNGTGRVLA